MSLTLNVQKDLITKRPREAFELLEKAARKSYSQQAPRAKAPKQGVHQIDSYSALTAQLEALSNKIEQMSVNKVQPCCEICGGAHHSGECSIRDRSVHEQNQFQNQGSSSGSQPAPEKRSNLEDMVARLLANSESQSQLAQKQNQYMEDRFHKHEMEYTECPYSCKDHANPTHRSLQRPDKRPCSEENQALYGISAFSEQIPRCALSCQILHWQCWPMHDRAPSCMTVQPGSARPCMVVLAYALPCTFLHDRATSARPCMVVLTYALPCISQARPCKLASAGPKQGSAGPIGGSAGHDDLRTTVQLLARPCLTPRVNFRDLAENGNCENRPRPKVKHCSTLHDRAPMVHDRAKFQNFYKLSFSPHFKGLDFLEPKYLLFRFLEAV
ncbi:hypothetical protein E3N88_09393 [Mikania micrantha]|uniref:Uncharacterized protein n=1 Tax=Mikania micrantha TaxID=192012 RepID=A0A5N6PJT5_9ASTR|nr:hypothetical protein E3N88_09393 [Mikania micrantha]